MRIGIGNALTFPYEDHVLKMLNDHFINFLFGFSFILITIALIPSAAMLCAATLRYFIFKYIDFLSLDIGDHMKRAHNVRKKRFKCQIEEKASLRASIHIQS